MFEYVLFQQILSDCVDALKGNAKQHKASAECLKFTLTAFANWYAITSIVYLLFLLCTSFVSHNDYL